MITPGVLIILDGWGYGAESDHNAISRAATPVMTRLLASHAWTVIQASGEVVGLPRGAVGNSEIGHLTIGAGRTIEYESTRVERAAAAGEFLRHPLLQTIFGRLRADGRALHLLGLNSDGMVHGHLNHFGILLEAASAAGLTRVFLHPSADGRDVPTGTARNYLKSLIELTRRASVGTIATVMGRAYTMDRSENWSRTEAAYRAIVLGEGVRVREPEEAIRLAALQGLADEWIPPSVITHEDGTPLGRLDDGDALICVNFRGDRMRQIVRALAAESIREFPRSRRPRIDIVTMTEYFLSPPVPVLFSQADASNGLADLLDAHGVRNVRIAETEKFTHVTFFLNGRDERSRDLEDYIHIPSPKSVDYRHVPELSAPTVAMQATAAIRDMGTGLVIINLANADVVGHTGDLEAVTHAVEAVDRALGRICRAARKAGRWAIIVGDHGNAEMMWDPVANVPQVGHTTNPVPFVVIHHQRTITLRPRGTLADVAPTIAELLGVVPPQAMTGNTLVRRVVVAPWM